MGRGDISVLPKMTLFQEKNDLRLDFLKKEITLSVYDMPTLASI